MQSSIVEQIRIYRSRNRRRRILKKFVQVMGCIVVFVTTYALILPAITMEQKAFCGFEEHSHTDTCMEKQYVSVLDCTAEKLGVHVHQAACYDGQNILTCLQADYVAHAHNECCFDEKGQLVCTLPERVAHRHDEYCYSTEETSAIEVHIHGEHCFKNEQGDLVCSLEESSGHLHDESCSVTGKTLLCTLVEDHEHTTECYQKELICTEPETVGHYHDASCYQCERILCCKLPEGQAGALEPAEQILICTVPIASEHSHTESCFLQFEQENAVVNCKLDEHIHSLICYSDLEADMETENVWKATFADVELTEDKIDNLLAIAESQIGYTESSRNYRVGDDNTIHGYTRYGDWYGDPYGEWPAMFTAFCLHYAQVEEIPYDADVSKWIEKLDELNLYDPAEEAEPEKGSLIFFDRDEDGMADHMGIIAEIKEATEHTGAAIKVIEGDSEKTVRNVSYRPEDDTIVGYFILGHISEADPETIPEEETHPDENLNINQNNAKGNTDAVFMNAQIYTDGRYQILADDAAVITLTGYIPEDAVVKAYPVTLETEMDILFAYDITIFHADGSIFEPVEGDMVNVAIQSPVLENSQDDISVYHIPEDGAPSLVDSNISDGELSFDTPHFSVYAVIKASTYTVSVSPSLSRTWTEVAYSTSGYQTLCALKFNVNDNDWNPVSVTISSNAFSDSVQPVVHEVTEWGVNQVSSTYKNNSVSFTVGGWEFRTHTYAVLLPPASMSSMVLTEDMVVSETMYVTKDVTIDLNGHTIRTSSDYTGAIFEVRNGTLTIRDSSAPSESSKQTTSNALSPHAASAVSTNNSVTLTYHVTDSQVTNSGAGATTETVYERMVTTSGVIMGGTGPAIWVNGGTVNIESGMLYGSTGRAIESEGNATINLSGGYICSFQGNDGGAIHINGGSLNISGNAVIAGNHAAKTGGAIYASGCNITMSGGVVSDNTVADPSCSNGGSGSDSGLGTYGGGGIAIQNCTITLSGGYITNNHSLATGYWSGGGGIYTSGGSTINISGGYITGNTANSGGGVKTRDYGGGSDTFNMIGGYICSNKSTYGEGGGISIGGGDSGTISAGYVNNNYADCKIDWGGGGIFVANDAKLQILNALVTDNDAGGFGGGIAGCSTARMYLSDDNGAAVYGNSAEGENLSGAGSTKNEDWTYGKSNSVFMECGYADLYGALNCSVGGLMLGSGASNWQGSCDGIPVSVNNKLDRIQCESSLGLTAHPNNDSIALAQAAAKVYISGNYAYTHGGGILCNGYLVMGRSGNMVVGARIEIKAGKIYQDLDQVAMEIPNNRFQFEIADERGTVVSTGTAYSNGEIVFSGRLPFSNKGTFVYSVYEKSGSIPGIDYDSTQYRLTVTVKETAHDSPMDGITATQCVIDNIKVERLNPQDNRWTTVSNINPGNSENGPVTLDLGKNTFVNVLREIPTDTCVTVNKVWANPEDTVPIRVTLQQNGKAHAEAELSAANNWTHTWKQLPIANDAGNSYEYTVVESDSDEFDATYSYGVREEDGSPVITITNTRRLYDLEVIKVSNHKSPLPLKGVKFRILNSENEPLYFVENPENVYIHSAISTEGAIEELTTDADGKIFISGLKAGNYKVEEIKALEGYQLAEVKTVTLGGKDMEENRIYSVTIVNKLIEYTLPETGGAGITHYMTAGFVLVIPALIAVIYSKISKKRCEVRMMKNIKKIFSFLLVMMVITSLSMTVFATDAPVQTHTITINNSTAGHTYEAYQILTGTPQTVNDEKILINVQWGANAINTGDVSTEAMTEITDGGAKKYVNFESTPIASTSTVSDGKYVISDLASGYYLVRDKKDSLSGADDAYTAFILEVVEDAEVSPKSAKPTVDKMVWDETADAETGHSGGWGETADHAINESFQFKLIATLPADEDFNFYDKYTIVFTDTMSDGITFDSIESVKVGRTTVAEGDAEGQYDCNATAGQAGGEWTLTISNLNAIEGVDLTDGTVVEVIYNAHLNENAKIDSDLENKNTVYLTFSNNPNEDSENELGQTVEDHVWVFTYQVSNTKTDENQNPLAGAGFTLYTDEDCKNEFKLIYDEKLMAYRPVANEETGEEMFSAEDGKFNIVGLDHGTYYLKETTVPDGYNPCDNVEIVITATHSEDADGTTATVTIDENSNTTNQVINKSGLELPETGGIGTTFMYIIGGALVFVAVVILITKLKMKQN